MSGGGRKQPGEWRVYEQRSVMAQEERALERVLGAWR